MNELGQAYKDGDKGMGLAPNEAKGREWLARAAESEPEAVYNLALLNLQSGTGEVDDNVAMFKEACNDNVPAACHNLGVAYRRGAGSLDTDLTKAVDAFELADNDDAFYALHEIHKELGDFSKAHHWLVRAANAGHSEAQTAVAQAARLHQSALGNSEL